MATYNFKTGGDIEVDGQVRYSISGPAVLIPNVVAGSFYLRSLSASDLFYYDEGRFYGHVYQIDGEEFVGTMDEFIEAANALYANASGGDTGNIPLLNQSNTFTGVQQEIVTGTGDAWGAYMSVAEPSNSSIGAFSDTNYFDIAAFNENGGGDQTNATIFQVGNSLMIQTNGGNTVAMIIETNGTVRLSQVAAYADNAAALTGGLVAGNVYRTGDTLKIVH